MIEVRQIDLAVLEAEVASIRRTRLWKRIVDAVLGTDDASFTAEVAAVGRWCAEVERKMSEAEVKS